MYKYLGALHIHSKYSDGGKSIEAIIKEAQKADLKWIIITDHNSLKAKEHEGYYGNLCVIAGTEITPKFSNHLLAFGTSEVINENIGEINYIDEVHKQGGICFPAHPDEYIRRENKHRPLRWNDWSIDTFDGLEIWNYLTDWTDNYSTKKSKIFQYLFRHEMPKGPTRNLLAWWDRLNNKKMHIVSAIGGLDAHGFSFFRHVFNIRIADYKDYFTSVNNLLLLDEPLSENFDEAKKQIFDALKHGNNIILNRKISKNTNVEFYIDSGLQQAYVGKNINLSEVNNLVVKIPRKAKIKIIHNGVCVFENKSKIIHFDNLSIGKYRIEVYYKNRPWIYSNPINIINSID